jgi:hypothetical protein
MIRLSDLQRQFQLAIMTAGTPVCDEAAPLADLLLPSRQLSWKDRFAVYENAYHLRLIECLREEFPIFRSTVSDDAFDDLARGYLREFPSRSYTLGTLSGEFIAHLRRTRPDRDSGDCDWFDFVIDLAEFEQTINFVFDGPGSEQSHQACGNESPGFTCCPSLRLLTLMHPVAESWARIKAGHSPTPCPPEQTSYAIYRRDFVVRYLRLEKAETQILSRLASGVPLDQALSMTIADGLSLSEHWLSTRCRCWATAGLVRQVARP